MRGLVSLGVLLLAAGAGAGCGVQAGDFIKGADHDPCQANIPVCQTTAGCAMNEATYLEGDFPGLQTFVVSTPADTDVEVRIFFDTRRHPGEDTEIRWYEPGCANYYVWESQGIDLFSKAGSDRVFSQTRKVRMDGDHLIEIYSDATCHYYMRVEFTHPN